MRENKKKKLSAAKFWYSLFDFDVFARQVYLTHMGKEKFSSSPGMILTIVFFITLFSKGLVDF
jgi:hypothetical protein